MRQAVTTCLMSFFLFLAVCEIATAAAGGPDSAGAIAQARRLIEANDHAAAMVLLEDALLEADNKHKPAIVDLLKETYESLAQKAQSEGREREAAHYRDNLAIIDQSRAATSSQRPTDQKSKTKPSPVPQVAPKRDFAVVQNVSPGLQPAKPPLPEAAPQPSPVPARQPPALPAPVKVAAPESRTKPPAKPALSQAPTAPNLRDADQLFTDKRYDEAGRAYAALARQNQLPANRAEHWAYCRWVEVARRLKLHPQSAREWDELEAEVAKIQQLAPKIWLGEYLRDKVAEARRDRGKSPTRSDALIVRGSAPDESQSTPFRFPRLFGKSRSDAAPPKQSPPTDTDAPGRELPLVLASDPTKSSSGRLLETDPATAGADSTADRVVKWETYDTPSFRIFHHDARLAEQAGEAAEIARASQARRWGSRTAQRPWAPRCELYLYPTGALLARETGQPDDSPGFSTMQSDGQRVVARRTNLRADHPQLLTAILPHEVTHVVLADLFTFQQIPRWADEGIAVLAEPRAEQERRIAELDEPLRTGRVFELDKLMAMDYPRANDWPLYYAQSVSLTRFLVEQGTPEQFVEFVRLMHAKGIAPALRAAYRIHGFDELQERWLEHAKAQLVPIKEVQREPDAQPSPPADR
jgi:hypothetical protein